MKIILASKSGVRKNILDKYKIINEVIVSNVDEEEIKISLLAEGATPLEISKNLAEIKSIPDWKCISPKQISIMMSQKSTSYGHSISVQIPRLKQPIPLVIVFRALGILSDKDICEKVVLDINEPTWFFV